MNRLLFLAPVLALAACVEMQPVPPMAPLPAEPVNDACRASTYQGLAGQPRSVLTTMLLPAGTRIIEAGDPVTADFSANRLNIEIDASGRIGRIACY